MKQNERLLVYAVTGFLALILVIAVVFGSDPGRGNKPNPDGTQGLSEILGEKSPDLEGDGKQVVDPNKPGGDNKSGLATPNQVTPEQPLVAKPQLAADLVARALGQSRRDRNVRFVRAKRGDSLELLVRRWCGSREAYFEEAECLNEQLTVLKVGQEVAVPWVGDEQLVALIDAREPRTLLTQPVEAGVVGAGNSRVSVPAIAGRGPDFQLPGSGGAAASGPTLTAAGTVTYTVKQGDSLWKIAANKYGKGKATRMIREIKRINPGLSENLKPDQKIKLPQPAE